MSCNKNDHDIFKNEVFIYCLLCNEQLLDCKSTKQECCDKPNIVKEGYTYICLNCARVQRFSTCNDFINVNTNKYKIRKMSVYKRRYHIEKILNKLHFQQNIIITHESRGKIYEIFVEIDKILSQINIKRKRSISIKFLLNKILSLIGYDIEIFTPKSLKTLFVYERYWFEIIRLVGNKINLIIKSEN